MTAHRRRFLQTAAVAGMAAFAGSARCGRRRRDRGRSVGARPGINPHIYGHFIEHLGGVIYDGIWVGRDSKIPNLGGLRKQFVDDMKRIGAPNLRWPGGCFADGYHWRDGIGAAARRPRTYNYWEHRMPPGRHATESNAFGIHEFMRLCRLVGAEPYLAANVGSGGPEGVPRLGLLLQRPRGNALPRRRARRQRRPGALQRQVLGRGQRIVGLRRQHDGWRIRDRVPQVHRPVSRLPAPVLRGHGAARALRRRRRGLDGGLLRPACRTCAAWASAWTASPCTTTPTSARPPKTAPSSTRRAGTPSCTRAPASRR